MVNVTINGRPIQVKKGSMILDAARQAGVHIPTLCHIKELFPSGACRMCVVEIEGRNGLLPSCAYPVEEGMKILTRSPRVLNARKTIVELLLPSHHVDCLTCSRNTHCELQDLAKQYNIQSVPYEGKRRHHYTDFSSPSIVRNPDKCILCGRCVRICEEIQGVAAIDFTKRGFDTIVLPAFNKDLSETTCVNCGQCVLACPTGALYEVSSVQKVVQTLHEGKKYMVAQAAPAIRVALGEFFNLKPGEDCTGKIASALRRMGFKKVFDTDFTADLTIMEEGTELVERIKQGGKLPMFTSCCPAWIKFAEQNYPELLDNISTCRSPQQMMGSLIKSYLAEKEGISPDDICVVSVMPCTAKKYEALRPEMYKQGVQDVDYVLTTREFASLMKNFGINFDMLPKEPFDQALGTTSGSGDIFAATGGVMESALRTAYNLITGKDLNPLDFGEVRGFNYLKESEVDIEGLKLKVAVVNTLGETRRLIERIKAGEAEYHFVEVMSCPGGCAGGGGQYYGYDPDKTRERIQAIYSLDKERPVRQSYKNDRIKELYQSYLEKPGSHKAHELLHTHYIKRPKRV
ncbi:MAG: iron hydrogenase small subunit [Spirochaetales bacterium]|nr:iron hydrogenase small subunit [Spirochaetales bacterium]